MICFILFYYKYILKAKNIYLVNNSLYKYLIKKQKITKIINFDDFNIIIAINNVLQFPIK